jgi:hypothetical protein
MVNILSNCDHILISNAYVTLGQGFIDVVFDAHSKLSRSISKSRPPAGRITGLSEVDIRPGFPLIGKALGINTMSFDVFIGELEFRKHFHQKMEVVDNIESLTETDPDLYLYPSNRQEKK